MLMKVVLASKSPRRRELLGKIYDSFEVRTREVDESLQSSIHPSRGVEILSVKKGEAVAKEESWDTLVISSDTLVELDGEPLGKPRDREEAYLMLRKLSGREHNVHTGVAVHYRGKVYSGHDSARVRFRSLSDGEIYRYIDTGEPMDKAGAYGIQGLGGRLVESYEGGFDTIMGLSLSLVRKLVNLAMSDGGQKID